MRFPIARVILVTGIAALAANSHVVLADRAPSFHDHGQITDVDPAHNRLTFTDDHGVTYTVDVGANAAVTLPGPQNGPPAGIGDLVAGMQAEIDGVPIGKSHIASSQIKVLPYNAQAPQPQAQPGEANVTIPGAEGTSATLHGLMSGGTSMFGRSIHVTIHGVDVKVDVPHGADVKLDGAPASVHQLPKGGRITVTGVWESGGKVRAAQIDASRQ